MENAVGLAEGICGNVVDAGQGYQRKGVSLPCV